MILENVKKAMVGLSPLSISDTDYSAKGFHLDVQIAPEQVVAAVQILDQEAFTLEAVTGVDLLTFDQNVKKPAQKKEDDEAAGEQAETPPEEKPEPQMEVVYDFSHWDVLCRVVIRARIPRDNPEIPTISDVYSGANWHERETHDFFGIKFIGHPNLEPLLLPEDADYHPLLKDFKA
jgi:NADH-quinone oxidoreductase subunit C